MESGKGRTRSTVARNWPPRSPRPTAAGVRRGRRQAGPAVARRAFISGLMAKRVPFVVANWADVDPFMLHLSPRWPRRNAG